MAKLFATSDCHLAHPNILFFEPHRVELVTEYLKLGAENPDEVEQWVQNALLDKKSEDFQKLLDIHDELIIKNWNETVSKDDNIIFLGDFAFCHKACKGPKNWNNISTEIKEKIVEYGNRLNGHKIMIMGNHDWRGQYLQGPMKGMYYVTPEIEQFWKTCGFEAVYPNPQVFKGFFEWSHEPSEYISPRVARFNVFAHVHSSPQYQTETEQSFCVCMDRHTLRPVEIKVFNEFDINEENADERSNN